MDKSSCDNFNKSISEGDENVNNATIGDSINVKNNVIAKRINIFENTPLCSNDPFKLRIFTVFLQKNSCYFSITEVLLCD
jgi:hypothetical protein